MPATPRRLADVPDHQRILVVSTDASDSDLSRLKSDLRRNPAVVTAPTAEAKRVVSALSVESAVAPESLTWPA